MLNEKQSIEVAEKVWGMTWLDLSQLRFDEGGYAPPDGLENIENYTTQLVNSWQGFGRTVEAMADKGKCIKVRQWATYIGFQCMDSMCQKDEHFHEKQIDDDLDFPQNLWQATHLAALEAVREEKE